MASKVLTDLKADALSGIIYFLLQIRRLVLLSHLYFLFNLKHILLSQNLLSFQKYASLTPFTHSTSLSICKWWLRPVPAGTCSSLLYVGNNNDDSCVSKYIIHTYTLCHPKSDPISLFPFTTKFLQWICMCSVCTFSIPISFSINSTLFSNPKLHRFFSW